MSNGSRIRPENRVTFESWVASGDDSTFEEWLDRPKPRPLTPYEAAMYQALANQAWSSQVALQRQLSGGILRGIGLGGIFG